jgi:hypothetical protein
MSQPDTLTTSPASTPPAPSALIPSLASKLAGLTLVKPTLKLEAPAQHPRFWICPKTGIAIPKTLNENLAWRQKLRDAAAMDDGLQRQLRAACKASVLFWVNAFVWTFRQKMVNDQGEEVPCIGHNAHWPFITYLVQDEAILELQECIRLGDDAGIDKSRDMGASWLCLALLHHFWQFIEGTTFLEVSRNEAEVDVRGDMDTLFEKHRYINRMQPRWLIPSVIRDNHMNLGNEDTGSTIMGETTNGDVGRGGRKTAILLDEFAAVQNGEEIDNSTADTTACRIFNSTPKAGSYFTKIVKSIPPRCRVISLPWWRHPEKGRGAHQIVDELGRPKWTSPWYEKEGERRSKKDIAQNLDMDHGGAGETFFDHTEIEKHRRAHCHEPVLRGDLLTLLGDLGEEGKLNIIKRKEYRALAFSTNFKTGAWRFYLPLIDGRPPQHLSYCFGVDISNGAGSSNSVITVVAHETGQVVAKFWSSNVSPEELAEIAALAGVWFGGTYGPAFICHENNGPGGIFGRKIVKKLGYPHLYFQRVEGTKDQQQTTRWGWHSNKARKEVLLGQYREALKTFTLVNPCKESLEECLDYVYDEGGTLIPGKLREETGGGRELHGDHVIADALANFARQELPKFRALVARAPTGSFAARRETHRKMQDAKDPWSN